MRFLVHQRLDGRAGRDFAEQRDLGGARTCPGAAGPRSSGSRCTTGGCSPCARGWSGARAPWPATGSRTARRSPRSSGRSPDPGCGAGGRPRISLWRLVRGIEHSRESGVKGIRPNRARTTIPEDRPKDKMPVTLDQILDLDPPRDRSLRSASGRRPALERRARDRRGRPRSSRRSAEPRSAVIAEVKRRSPSAGSHPGGPGSCGAGRARTRRDGAAADLGAHRRAVLRRVHRRPACRGGACAAAVPLLRKDFILDELQVARGTRPRAPRRCCSSSAHSRPERLRDVCSRRPRRAGSTRWSRSTPQRSSTRRSPPGPASIGVNSRDLDTFRIDTVAAWRLLARVPQRSHRGRGERDGQRGGRRARGRRRCGRGADRLGTLGRGRAGPPAGGPGRGPAPWALRSRSAA